MKLHSILMLALTLALSGAGPAGAQPAASKKEGPATQATAKATFAGGCFWCMEEAFDKVPGVIATTSGYMGGQTKNPTYEQVSTGRSGHAEVVQVEYDPAKVTYEKLLDAFWRNIDPTQKDAQFCDHGTQYRSAVFYHNDEQRRAVEASRTALAGNKPFKGEIVTQVAKADVFYPAEGYHQDYYQKNPVRYQFYKSGCGREARLKELWGSRPK
ncbi:MAG TPA: peptide-methionine (S)-S-oxide reductase MsrA [Burkholderiales bacterium]|jgi:peptide-methionine (S)-S-oxide reductase|nr:peptide-methionine (S)-S-oxide reductase MsrA [Burkholderiales bacterium]